MPLPKIVSDGTQHGTHVYDQNGNEIRGISAVSFHINVDSQLGKLTIEFPVAEAEVSGEISEEEKQYAVFKAFK